MSPSLARLAPTAVVAAMVTWCCWPYLEPGPGRIGRDGSDLPQVAAELYAPPREPPAARDPFCRVIAKKPEPARKPEVAQRKAPPKPESPKPAEEASIPSVVAVHVAPRDILSRFTLEGTYIRGDQRVAIINGQVFQRGQKMPISDVSQDLCTITEIGPYKVVLWHRGRSMDLTYRNPTFQNNPLAETRVVGGQEGQTALPPPGTP